MNIQQLRQLGYQVKIIHNRRMEYIEALDGPKPILVPRGGSTNVIIEKDGKAFGGLAVCSTKDNYDRKLGVKVATARAMAKCEFLREKVPNLFV